MPVTFTTDLPDAQGLDLDASVQSELTAVWNPVLNNGRYRLEYRDDDPDGNHPDYQHVATVGWDGTLEETITGLVDGEQYSIRVRTETDYATGDWLAAEKVTKIISPDGITAVANGETVIDLGWNNNSDFRGSNKIYRRRTDYDYGDEPGRLVGTVGAGDTAYTDDSVSPGREYEFVIRSRTQWVYADSDPETVATDDIGLDDRAVPPRGWYAEVDHPEGITFSPPILDGAQYQPQPQDLPTVQIPVERNDRWLSDNLEGATMRVWRNGDRLPIEMIESIKPEEGQNVLVGIGGTELRDRVEAEVDQQPTHEFVQELIQNNTPYTANVDAPENETQEDVQMQSFETTAEFLGALDIDDDTPLEVSNDQVIPLQTSYSRAAMNSDSGASGSDMDDSYNDGEAAVLFNNGDYREYTETFDYRVPADAIGAHVLETGANPILNMTVKLIVDGTEHVLDDLPEGAAVSTGWRDFAQDPRLGDGYTGSDIEPGDTVTLRLEANSSDGQYGWEVISLTDNRFDYNFDETVHEPGGYLNGPQDYPKAIEVTFNDAETPFAISAGRANIDTSHTDNNQSLALSNDFGGSWTSASNTTSIDTSFASAGAAITLRVTLSRTGERNTQTPRTGFEPHTLSAIDLYADIDQTPLTIDQRFDNQLLSVMQDRTGQDEFTFGLGWNDGITVEWTQPRQRAVSMDLPVSDRSVTKEMDLVSAVTVKGANREVSQERFVADSEFVPLANDNLVHGSETVYDADGTRYDRGEDYSIRYTDGEIRRLNGSNLVDGESYRIDYRHDVQGRYAVENTDIDGYELVEEISELTSVRACEQTAAAIATELSEPRWNIDLTLPSSDIDLPVASALVLDDAEIPDAAMPIEIGGVDYQSDMIRVNGGRGQSADDVMQNIRDQIQSIARRSS